MDTSISNAFFEQFNIVFDAVLSQQGSMLMNYVTQEPIQGDVKYLRLYDIGDAHFVDTIGSPTSYTSASFYRRKLEPRPIECAVMIDQYHLVQTNGLDMNMIAQTAANKCGILLDKIIIKSLGGIARTVESGDIKLPNSQIIKADTNALGNKGKTSLTAAKIAKAVEMLRSKFNQEPLVCVTNALGLAELRTDEKIASSIFNTNPAMAIGQNMPFAGCNAFVACEECEKTTSTQYAYVYALNQIKLGCSMPFHIEVGQNAERSLNNVFIVKGMYDCVRMQEEAVVKIEWQPTA